MTELRKAKSEDEEFKQSKQIMESKSLFKEPYMQERNNAFNNEEESHEEEDEDLQKESEDDFDAY